MKRLPGARVARATPAERGQVDAGLVDEMHLAIAPTLLGRGEALLAGIDLPALGWRCTRHAATGQALHVVLTRGA